MIDKESGRFILICDICGEEVGNFKTFEDALEYRYPNGWSTGKGQRLDLKEGWIDMCPNCGGKND